MASPFCLPSVFWESEFRLTSAESSSKLWKLLLEDRLTRSRLLIHAAGIVITYLLLCHHREAKNRRQTETFLFYLRKSLTSPCLFAMVDHWLTSGMERSLARWDELQGMRAELEDAHTNSIQEQVLDFSYLMTPQLAAFQPKLANIFFSS